ncbi:MAG: hypothetical protein ACHP9T_17030 [Caulobacterales bacterium]|jgi:hypothetical protein
MTTSLDRFLGPNAAVATTQSLGRIFNVTRETWLLTDDPKAKPPQLELMVAARTASEAADLARDAAAEFSRHGFHKPSGAWWAADNKRFHRFVVHTGRRRGATGLPLAVLAVAGVAALGLAGLGLRRRKPEAKA